MRKAGGAEPSRADEPSRARKEAENQSRAAQARGHEPTRDPGAPVELREKTGANDEPDPLDCGLLSPFSLHRPRFNRLLETAFGPSAGSA